MAKPTAAAVKVAATPRVFVKTVHAPGYMENPFTKEVVTHIETPIKSVDSWFQEQIDAEKLELVE